MDAVGDPYKDPLHNIQSPTATENNHYLTNGIDETTSAHDQIIYQDSHPQLRFCSTSCWCMIIGVTITCGSIAMTACSYFAEVLATETFMHRNVTEIIVDDHLRLKLAKLKTIGPILIGLGIFFMLCAFVLLCEARDRLNQAEDECEKILPGDYNGEDTYKTAATIKAEALAITPGMDISSRSSSSEDSESSGGSFVNDHQTAQYTNDCELPYESSRRESPVVIIHGTSTSGDEWMVPERIDSLKRPNQADEVHTDEESSPKTPDCPVVRKLPKLQYDPPTSSSSATQNKTPKLLELNPSKLPGNHVNKSVFPKPLSMNSVNQPPLVNNGNGTPGEEAPPATGTNNQLLQTDFPSPSSSCEPSPVRAPRPHHRSKNSLTESHPTNIFLLQNMSSSSNNNSNSNLLPRTIPQSDRQSSINETSNCDEVTSFSGETDNFSTPPVESNHHENDDADMETCIDTQVDNVESIETQHVDVSNVSNPIPTEHHQTENDTSLPESEQDLSQRDTNSNITASTASVHSHNSNQSPHRTIGNNNKRKVVLV